jgi:GMP synthase (glutamine-hydrolysing)
MADEARHLYGIQFHPEVLHTEMGVRLLDNFLSTCKARRDWTPASIHREAVSRIRDRVPEGIIVALSGGVDLGDRPPVPGGGRGRTVPIFGTQGCCAWTRATPQRR